MGMLWSLYVELRIYQNYRRIFRKTVIMMLPWAVEVIMVLSNLSGTGLINDFKYINDNFGHSMGDKANSTVGNILCRSIPDAGMAIRYAGDEFIVLLPGVDAECVSTTGC